MLPKIHKHSGNWITFDYSEGAFQMFSRAQQLSKAICTFHIINSEAIFLLIGSKLNCAFIYEKEGNFISWW